MEDPFAAAKHLPDILGLEQFITEKDSRCRAGRPVATRYDAPYVLPKNHSDRVNMNCWGWMTPTEPASLVEIARHTKDFWIVDFFLEYKQEF
ncbi:hypothetical protein TSAR_004754 [Trichomalopsis sarcophagae]|uniref:Uncharacterized protein n=1 Tax=Trichomalopsis sarcophagae TaxID=543379 RepID=A0A232FKE1_9HYME|nr:hypothetical protein TSAR_004754 [Trichomalopsis sarcophagae]